MPCLWIHRASGSDFLVRGDEATLVKLGRDILSQDSDSLINTDFNSESNDIGNSPNVQISLEQDYFLPDRHFYDEISYVTLTDAYKMTVDNIFPENHCRTEYSTFKLPKGFIIRNREEPYDFTCPILTHDELDKQLEAYFI
jgi:hypothetical protein